MRTGDRLLVLCVDGERSTLDVLDLYLTDSDLIVSTAESAREALAKVTMKSLGLIVLGLELPDMSGFEVLRRIKGNADTAHIPIIVLSEQQEEIVKILALEMGAADYIEKPFSGRELVARVRTVLRSEPEPDLPVIITNGPLTIDRDKQEAYLNGVIIPLEMREFMILCELMMNIGQILTIYQLGNRAWGYDCFDADTAARMQTRRLKKKLKEYGYLIEAIRDDAFRMVAYSDEQ